MTRTLRAALSDRSGLARTGLLLACAGCGAALVLASVVLFGGGSRAAERARPADVERSEAATDDPEPAEAADLVPATALEDAALPPDAAPSALVPPTATLAATAADAPEATAGAEAKAEGPKLRVLKGEGQREELGKGEVGSRSRKQLREQRARDAEQAAATGETRASPAKKTVDPEQRARVGRRKRPDGG